MVLNVNNKEVYYYEACIYVKLIGGQNSELSEKVSNILDACDIDVKGKGIEAKIAETGEVCLTPQKDSEIIGVSPNMDDLKHTSSGHQDSIEYLSTSYIISRNRYSKEKSRRGRPTKKLLNKDQLSDFIKCYKELFFALANKNRLKIVRRLYSTENGINVGDLSEYIGHNQTATSYHLKILKDLKMVHCKKNGYHTNYFLNKDLFRKALSYEFGNSSH